MQRSLFSLACLVVSVIALSACNPNSNQPPRSSSFGSDGRPTGNNGNSLSGNSSIYGNNNGSGNSNSSPQQNTPLQDSTTIAALSLGIPPTSQVDLNLNAPIIATPNPDSISAPAPSSVPEPTTAIFVGSGICFFIISRLRKRQEIFDYYNK